MYSHISNQHRGDSFECIYCGKFLKTRQSLSVHKKTHIKHDLQNFEEQHSIIIKSESLSKNESVLNICTEVINDVLNLFDTSTLNRG